MEARSCVARPTPTREIAFGWGSCGSSPRRDMHPRAVSARSLAGSDVLTPGLKWLRDRHLAPWHDKLVGDQAIGESNANR
jgi:hypothetical protein